MQHKTQFFLKGLDIKRIKKIYSKIERLVTIIIVDSKFFLNLLLERKNLEIETKNLKLLNEY